MISSPFIARSARYDRNREDGRLTHALTAVLNTPNMTTEPGVAILTADHVQMVIPLADALRIANQIADIASA